MADNRAGRNPLIVPSKDEKPAASGRVCPGCGGQNYGGLMTQGYVKFECRDCRTKWEGGIGLQPEDPTVPKPPENPRTMPLVDFIASKELNGRPVEVRIRRPDPTPDFRKGAPLQTPGDE